MTAAVVKSSFEALQPESTPSIPWDEWLCFDATAPSTPAVDHSKRQTSRLELQFAKNVFSSPRSKLAPLSPQLVLTTDVTSPGSIRPYNIPRPTDTSKSYFDLQSSRDVEKGAESPSVNASLQPQRSHPHTTAWIEPFHAAGSTTVVKAPPSHKVSPPRQDSITGKKRKHTSDETVHIQSLDAASGAQIVRWGNLNTRRARMDDESRQAYRDTRSKGACPVCKQRRKRCDRTCFPYIDCLSSKKIIFLDRPVNMRLFRQRPVAGHPLASCNPALYALADLGNRSPFVIHTRLRQDFDSELQDLEVPLCAFAIDQNLKTSHVYVTSKGRQIIELPRLCLANVRMTTLALETYIKRSWRLYLRHIATHADPIVRDVLLLAQRHVCHPQGKSSLVHRALMLLSVNRMIEHHWTLSGIDQTGIGPDFHPESPWFGKRPVTPVMDTQLDQIIIQTFLEPLREKLLLDLQNKMLNGAKRDWYEIFLTVFILQLNTALLLRHSRKNAIKCGAPRRYNSLDLALEYLHGSNILLAHFHHGSNGFGRALMSSDSPARSHLALDQRLSLELIMSKVNEDKFALSRSRNDKVYEADMYWTSQMFMGQWTPEDRVICEEKVLPHRSRIV